MNKGPSKSRHLVDPEILSAVDQFPTVDLTDEILHSSRESHAKVLQQIDVTEDYPVSFEQLVVPSSFDGPDIRIEMIKPLRPKYDKMPFYYSIHGGGMVSGSAAGDRTSLAALAAEHGLCCAAVDYRLAPEHVQPSQLQDCYSGLKWCVEHADELRIDATRIAIGGSSAGAGLAAGLALYIRDQQEFDIHHLRLRNPMLDDRTAVTPEHPYAGEFFWTKGSNYFGWESVLGHEPGQDEVSEYYVPARASSLSGLPPTYISIGSIDLFIDEALRFAKQLAYDGVPVELHVYPGYHHMSPMFPQAHYAQEGARTSEHALLKALGLR
ncbi:alpha/beta hydrolase fold domain-containing protein [Paenibacillus sp. IB182496]|uniref:Alpha/beta hydrolase fold domain-containing protein n=1 Tax=Paenibacillus sabuli TaxID=2772509 RepID=A0A927BP30_9BACL|nr:alpha/beta hydrolase fold domain-containing protein [Paenibacillus sabuli]MBD2843652.1 alpha/beta hydrolase fold domain-containing protein [Paenibacillus sabuli]